MSKDKQIEEMAKVIGDADQRCYEMDCDDCPLHDTELGLCKEKFNATELYEKGYRKASEVAREIFEEIEKIVTLHHDKCYEYEDGDECDTAITYLSYVAADIDRFKQKYTEGGE